MCIKRAARRVHCRARKGGKVGGRRFLIKKDWRGGSLLVSLFQPLYEYVCINRKRKGEEHAWRLMNRNGIATTVLINFNSDICQGWGWFSLCSSWDKKDCRRKKETHSFLHLFFFYIKYSKKHFLTYDYISLKRNKKKKNEQTSSSSLGKSTLSTHPLLIFSSSKKTVDPWLNCYDYSSES